MGKRPMKGGEGVACNGPRISASVLCAEHVNSERAVGRGPCAAWQADEARQRRDSFPLRPSTRRAVHRQGLQGREALARKEALDVTHQLGRVEDLAEKAQSGSSVAAEWTWAKKAGERNESWWLRGANHSAVSQ